MENKDLIKKLYKFLNVNHYQCVLDFGDRGSTIYYSINDNNIKYISYSISQHNGDTYNEKTRDANNDEIEIFIKDLKDKAIEEHIERKQGEIQKIIEEQKEKERKYILKDILET